MFAGFKWSWTDTCVFTQSTLQCNHVRHHNGTPKRFKTAVAPPGRTRWLLLVTTQLVTFPRSSQELRESPRTRSLQVPALGSVSCWHFVKKLQLSKSSSLTQLLMVKLHNMYTMQDTHTHRYTYRDINHCDFLSMDCEKTWGQGLKTGSRGGEVGNRTQMSHERERRERKMDGRLDRAR